MSQDQRDISITVLGKKYNIRCPADKVSDLQESAVLLDKKMAEVRDNGKMVGVDRIAVIAALNLSHELLTYKNQKESYIQMMNDRIQALQEKIESVL